MIFDRTDNWLAAIAVSDHPNHSIRGNLGDLTAEMVQASFDATYGKGKFKATNHVTVITVWSHLGCAAQLRDYAKRSRERGNEERANELEARAVEAETGNYDD